MTKKIIVLKQNKCEKFSKVKLDNVIVCFAVKIFISLVVGLDVKNIHGMFSGRTFKYLVLDSLLVIHCMNVKELLKETLMKLVLRDIFVMNMMNLRVDIYIVSLDLKNEIGRAHV